MEIDYQSAIDALPLLGRGLVQTFLISALALFIGSLVGFAACLGRLQESGPAFWLASTYIDTFRTIPEMVLIFWVYSCAPLLFGLNMSAYVAGIAVLSLYAGAYLAEIFRAGVLAVPRGQVEAAGALGVSAFWIWFSVIGPQALRIMVPTFMNFITELVKVSALLSAIGVPELFFQARTIAAGNYRFLELLTTVGVLYFLLLFPLSLVAGHYEQRQSRLVK